MRFAPGATVEGYRVDELLGRGGMGVIYRATQLALDRTIALKVVAPELAGTDAFRERFKREARLAAALDHPHVVPIYEAGEVDGELFLAMRFVDGRDLASVIRAERRLDPERAVRIVEQTASALDAAHARGLVHRDVKPANVLLEDRPTGEHAYLTDFGLVRALDEGERRLTGTGTFMGSADYVSPEQILGSPTDARSDGYALACVLYAALTGVPPFRRDTETATLTAQVREPPPAVSATRPELGGRFDGLLRRALSKVPGDRYPTCGALAAAARSALREHPAIATAPAPTGTDADETIVLGPSATGPVARTEPTGAGPTVDPGVGDRPADAAPSPPDPAASPDPAPLADPAALDVDATIRTSTAGGVDGPQPDDDADRTRIDLVVPPGGPVAPAGPPAVDHAGAAAAAAVPTPPRAAVPTRPPAHDATPVRPVRTAPPPPPSSGGAGGAGGGRRRPRWVLPAVGVVAVAAAIGGGLYAGGVIGGGTTTTVVVMPPEPDGRARDGEYIGQTTAGQTLRFTVVEGEMRAGSTRARFTCTDTTTGARSEADQDLSVDPGTRARLDDDGRFEDRTSLPAQRSLFSGQVAPDGSAQGVIVSEYTTDGATATPDGGTHCTTGELRWTARRE
ncbi:MAG: serine/threonine protein kinase [Solirubrobacteraceae bacterium]|nr:serine/threonine protein kinase [Solirubrobacteraceae bacterium]